MPVEGRPGPHRVVVLALPDVVAFDLAIPAQVFGHQAERARYSFRVCAPQPGLVRTTTGFSLTAGAGLAALRAADTVVVPGFTPMNDPPAAVSAALRAAAARGARMASICTGAFALAAAGLLDGRPATTHWHNAAELAARFPKVRVNPDVLYIDDGAVLTSAGVAAGLDLCLHLFRIDHGADAAAAVARRMVAPPHRSGGQAQYLERPVPPTGTGTTETCAWALAHLDQPLTVPRLAAHAGYSPRTFARHFCAETGLAPLQWLTAQRVHAARRLLESTDLTIDAIAARTGLGTAANLRLHLRRAAATTPSAYRTTFRGDGAGAVTIGRGGVAVVRRSSRWIR